MQRLPLGLHLLLLLTLSCSTEERPQAVATAPDSQEAAADGGNAAVDSMPTGTDTASPEPTALPFSVGVARTEMPAPVGIGTAGFGQIGAASGETKSRFAEGYPATRGIYTQPTLHAVAVETEEHTLVWLRVDLVGITQTARQAILSRIQQRGGPELDSGLVIAATHTHSGPGRLIDNPIWGALADSFFPEFYERFIDAAADTVLVALDDLEPARFAYTVAEAPLLHADRRCQNPELRDSRMPILRFDREDGSVKALVLLFAVHGTEIGADRLILSRDFHGGLELKIEEQFDQPVTVLAFNSWSGDMKPETPQVDEPGAVHPDFNGIEAAGNIAADIVTAAIQDLPTSDTLLMRSRFGRVPLNREELGYADDVFLYEYGAVYCGAGIEAGCYGEPPPDSTQMTTSCIPFGPDFPAWPHTLVGVLQFNDLVIATLPGEPVTQLGLNVLSGIEEETGVKNVAFLGYAQDYVGYSLPEDDWYMGGYEASGSIWGPRQGDYLAARAVELATHVLTGSPLPWDSLPPDTPVHYDVGPYPVESSAVETGIVVQPESQYASLDGLVRIVVHGGDPWLMAPHVTLEARQEDGSFEPHRRKNGTPVASDGYEFERALSVTPSYGDEEGPTSRTFAWTITMPVKRGASTTTPALSGGTYRLRVQGRVGAEETYDHVSEAFSVD